VPRHARVPVAKLRTPVLPEPRGSVVLEEETEDERQLYYVWRLLCRALNDRQVIDACRERFGIGQTRTLNLIARVRQQFRTAYERNPYARVSQIARLHGLLAELHEVRYSPTKTIEVRDPDTGEKKQVPLRLPKNVAEIERVERLLAELEGNRTAERVEVQVSMTAAAQVVFAQLTPERLEEFVERARERRRLALVASNGKEI
jgi:hypothetical protein